MIICENCKEKILDFIVNIHDIKGNITKVCFKCSESLEKDNKIWKNELGKYYWNDKKRNIKRNKSNKLIDNSLINLKKYSGKHDCMMCNNELQEILKTLSMNDEI